MQRVRDLRTLSHKRDVFIKSLLFGLREPGINGDGGEKTVRAREDGIKASRLKRDGTNLNSQKLTELAARTRPA